MILGISVFLGTIVVCVGFGFLTEFVQFVRGNSTVEANEARNEKIQDWNSNSEQALRRAYGAAKWAKHKNKSPVLMEKAAEYIGRIDGQKTLKNGFGSDSLYENPFQTDVLKNAYDRGFRLFSVRVIANEEVSI